MRSIMQDGKSILSSYKSHILLYHKEIFQTIPKGPRNDLWDIHSVKKKRKKKQRQTASPF